MTNLYARLDRMDLLEPLFMDLTWGAGACKQTRRTALTVTAHAMCFGSESHWAVNSRSDVTQRICSQRRKLDDHTVSV